MARKSSSGSRVVYIVDGSRTPFLKALGKPGAFSASDLAVAACRSLLARQPFHPSDINEVITGCMVPNADEANIARIIALRLGCGEKVPAWTVQRNCASGMQALDNAYKDILTGRHDLVLAGGTDAMSRGPLIYNKKMVNWFVQLNKSRGAWAKTKTMFSVPLAQAFNPIIALLVGLTDPVINLNMGQTAENLAYLYHVSRKQMDEFAVQSHVRLGLAQQEGIFNDEIVPLYANNGNVIEHDEGYRSDSSVEKLAKLKPVFDKKFGAVTAGNSSQVTDGAAFLIMASEDAINQYQLPVLGKIVDVQWSALDPAQMGLGPVFATSELMERQQLTNNDIDYWELNEAFAAQVLACLNALNDKDFCVNQLGLKNSFGLIEQSKLNIDGGAISIGHPVGASGARIVLHLLNVLKRKNAKRGVATICIGGGQGGAMLVENVGEGN